MEALLAIIEAGIVSGSIYSLIAVGMTLLLVVADVIQFAYGQAVVISIFFCWLTLHLTNSVVLSFFVAAVVSTVLQFVLEPLLRTLRERKLVLETLILTIAVGMILTEAMCQYFNAGMPIAFPDSMAGGGWALSFRLIRITAADLYVVVATVASLAVLAFFLFKTRQGKTLRAMAYNIQVSRLLGIPIRKCTTLSFVVAGFLSALTAILLILALGAASPVLGENLTFKGLAVMMLGGMGNLKGAVLGGFILGLIEALVRGYLIGDWADAVGMGVIMFVITLKPAGLLGQVKQG